MDVICTAPVEFFKPKWDDIPEEHQDEIERYGPLPCCGSGGISLECINYNCFWAEYDDRGSEPI